MTLSAVPGDVETYIEGFEPAIQAILRQVQATVRAAAPAAIEVISYRMPALKGRGMLVYYAAFKHHIGFYPPVRGDPDLQARAAPYAGAKGNLRFPYARPMPLDLIAALTTLRARQDAATAVARRSPRARSIAVPTVATPDDTLAIIARPPSK